MQTSIKDLATNWCYDFNGDGQAFPKFPNSKFAMFSQYLKKGVRDEFDVDKHQSFLQVNFIWYYHHSWVWWDILKVFKVTRL